MDLLSLPFPVLNNLLNDYLDHNSCLKLLQLSQSHRSELRELVYQKLILKKLKLQKGETLSWLQFPYKSQNAAARTSDILRTLGSYVIPDSACHPQNTVGFRRARDAVQLERCCLGNKVIAMSNVQGTDQVFVLYTKGLRVYDTNVLCKPHPPCTFFYTWPGPPAVRGELLISCEGSYVVVWRWNSHAGRSSEVTILDVGTGSGPITHEVTNIGYRLKPVRSLLEQLERCTNAAWVSDFSLFFHEGSRPFLVHFCAEGGTFLKEELHARKTDTILCDLLSRTTTLQSFAYSETDPDFLSFTMLAAGSCPSEKPAGNACQSHRLTVFKVKSLNVTELQSIFFAGPILDIKVTHAQAVIMMQYDQRFVKQEPGPLCRGSEYTGQGGQGFLYFYQCTKNRWDPVLLFKSYREAIVDVARPISHQWSITESKLIYRLQSLRLVEVPLYWLKGKKKQCSIREEIESVALGSHGDIYSSSGSLLARSTGLTLRKGQRVRLLQSLVRV